MTSNSASTTPSTTPPTITLNGTLVSNIVIDTSSVATDQNGLTATSTRTVIIEAATAATSTAL